MKKHFTFNSGTLLSLLLFMPVILLGQTAWKTSGNAVSPGDILGSTNARNLLIYTNNLQRMVVTSTGNVGVGTTSPAFKLDVTGNGNYSGTLKIGAYTLPSTDGSSGQVLKTNGLGTLSWQSDQVGSSQWNVSGSDIYNNNSGKVGIGTSTPAFKLDVNGNGNYSGTLKIGAYTLPSVDGTGGQLLGTDGSGNVSWQSITGSQWVTSGSNLYNTSAVYIGIGTSTPGQKLDVTGNGYYTIGNFINATADYDFFGVVGKCDNGTNHGTGVLGVGGLAGIEGDGGNSGNGNAIGVIGRAGDNGTIGILGVGGPALGRGVVGQAGAIGVQGTGEVGVEGLGTGTGGIGIDASGTSYAGYFSGDVVVTGTFSNPSDRKLKQDIKPLTGALDIITKLNPSVYTYRTNEFKQMHLPGGTHYGLIADEVQVLLPGAVKKSHHLATFGTDVNNKDQKLSDAVEFNSVNYIEMIPLLIGAVKEQQATIISLQDEVNQLKTALASNSKMNDGTVSVSLADDNSTKMLLGQNIPNPADKNTIIPFRISKNCNSAAIVISENGTGRIIKAIPVSCAETHLAIDAGTLVSGTYSYSLYVDGKIVDTKQMVMVK